MSKVRLHVRNWALLFPMLAGIALVGTSTPGSSAEITPALKAVIQKAEKEQKLRVVWAEGLLGGSAGAKRIETAMNKAYGTNVSLVYSPAGGMAAMAGRVAMELAAGQTPFLDVVIGGAAAYPALLKRDALERIDWAALAPDRFVDGVTEVDGRAVRFAAGYQGADYNPQTAPMKPTSYQDFLRPEWKGKIATSSYASGFEVLARKDLWGPERTVEYVKKLIPQLSGFMGCAEIGRLVTGEFSGFVTNCMGTVGPHLKAQGAPIESIVATDAPVRRYYYFAIPKRAENPNAAKLFITYMLSEEGQALIRELSQMDLQIFPGVARQIAEKYEGQGLKFVDFTIESFETHPEMMATLSKVIKMFRRVSR